MLVNKWPVLWKCCKHEHLVPGEWRDGIIVVDRCIATPSSILVHQNAVFFYKPFWAEFNRIDSDFGDLFCDVGHTLLIPRVCWVFNEKRSLNLFCSHSNLPITLWISGDDRPDYGHVTRILTIAWDRTVNLRNSLSWVRVHIVEFIRKLGIVHPSLSLS